MRIRKEIEVRRPLREAFAYVAEFSNAAEWDPGIAEARRLTDGPVGQGTEFEVVALFRGKRHRFHYVVTGFEPERRVVLSGDGDRARSVDEIAFEPIRDGTRITYIDDFHLTGWGACRRPITASTRRPISALRDTASYRNNRVNANGKV